MTYLGYDNETEKLRSSVLEAVDKIGEGLYDLREVSSAVDDLLEGGLDHEAVMRDITVALNNRDMLRRLVFDSNDPVEILSAVSSKREFVAHLLKQPELLKSNLIDIVTALADQYVHVKDELSSLKSVPVTAPKREEKMRILFLDDMEERWDTFREGKDEIDIIWAQNAIAAISELNYSHTDKPEFSHVFLDHDLDPGAYAGTPQEKTGMDVVNFIVRHAESFRGTHFWVHTLNTPAAHRMSEALHGAGLRVTVKPFGWATVKFERK